MGNNSKVASALLLTLEMMVIIAILSMLNLCAIFLDVLIYKFTIGFTALVEGLLLWFGNLRNEHPLLPCPVKLLCAYAPSLLIALFLCASRFEDGFADLCSMLYFWTSVIIAAVGVLSAVLTPILVKLKIL